MICYRQKCIFVHIPKSGGTSIENVIWGPDWSTRTEDQLWMGAVRPGFNKYQSGGLQHLLAHQIREEVGTEVFNACFKFTFVRNPWDRVISQFTYMKKRQDLRRFVGMRRWTSFKKYLSLIQKTPHVQWFEQWRFLYDDEGRLLVDFVGRFEDLAKDFHTVLARLNRPHETLPHAMKSDRRHYTHYYDDESRAIVGDIYRKDIELFKYAYETAG